MTRGRKVPNLRDPRDDHPFDSRCQCPTCQLLSSTRHPIPDRVISIYELGNAGIAISESLAKEARRRERLAVSFIERHGGLLITLPSGHIATLAELWAEEQQANYL